MAMNPLVASEDATTSVYAESLASAVSAHVDIDDSGDFVVLTTRGRHLLARLFEAEPSTVAQVERLLAHPDADLVSPSDAAALLGVSRPTVVRWAEAGQLTDFPVGTHHRFSRSEVLELRQTRAQHALENRIEAAQARAAAVADGADLDVPPTPQELVAAGRALRKGDRAAADKVLVRARRSGARQAAAAAAQES
jgi:excisionase family DNA binding protein